MKKKTIKEKRKEQSELLLEVLFEENNGDEMSTFQDYAFIQRGLNLMKTRQLVRRKPQRFNEDMMNIIDLALSEQSRGINPYQP